MENNIIDRLNLYDILAMVFPGAVWLLCIITIGDFNTDVDARTWTWVQTLTNAKPEVSTALCIGLLLFIVAYLIGLIQDTIIHYIRNWCRDKKCDVLHLEARFLRKLTERRLTKEKNEEKIAKYRERKDLLDKLIDDFEGVRTHARKDDANNNTIYTIEFQCAMIKGLLLPLSLLVCLSLGKCGWAIPLEILTFIVLGWLLFARTRRLIDTILRHYKDHEHNK